MMRLNFYYSNLCVLFSIFWCSLTWPILSRSIITPFFMAWGVWNEWNKVNVDFRNHNFFFGSDAPALYILRCNINYYKLGDCIRKCVVRHRKNHHGTCLECTTLLFMNKNSIMEYWQTHYSEKKELNKIGWQNKMWEK